MGHPARLLPITGSVETLPPSCVRWGLGDDVLGWLKGRFLNRRIASKILEISMLLKS